jgi:hemerythrin superfamily protein
MSEHDFLKHLRKDHDKQKKLGEQLVDASQPEERKRLRQQFYESLYPHMIGEEDSIFQLLTGADDEDAKQDGLEGLQEHHIGKIVLRELMELDLQSNVFRAKAKILDELNRHHIEEEEEAVFGHLKKLCSDQELDRLFNQYEQSEEGAKS